MDKDDFEALDATVKAAGFTGVIRPSDCLAFGAATPEGSRAVHSKTNEQLLSVLLSNTPGNCIHITGEMRALADPYHRRLCAEIAKQTATRFVVIYDIPEEHSQSPDGVGMWNARKWASKAWPDKLSAMNLIGDALVDVRAYNTLHEIQYSVFGNKYVLLQERHRDEGDSTDVLPKRAWLLGSERLNEFLSAQALEIVGRSRDIPETLFKRFFARVSGVTSQNILAKLSKMASVNSEALLDRALLDFDPDAADDVQILLALGFIQSNSGKEVSLTGDGKRFVEALQR